MEGIAKNRAAITRTNKENRLVHAVLPSLRQFRTVVDLRPSFSEDGTVIRYAVPVIIALIANDLTDEVWVQMSKKQAEELISDLQDVLRKITALEQWAAKQPYTEDEK